MAKIRHHGLVNQLSWPNLNMLTPSWCARCQPAPGPPAAALHLRPPARVVGAGPERLGACGAGQGRPALQLQHPAPAGGQGAGTKVLVPTLYLRQQGCCSYYRFGGLS